MIVKAFMKYKKNARKRDVLCIITFSVILFVHIFYHEKCTRRLQQYEIRFHQIVEEHQNRQLQQKQSFKEKNRTSKITAEIQIKSQTEYNITHNRKVEQLPHLVLGILSLTEDPVRRTAVRATWISTLIRLKQQIPFRITYKFLLDKPTNDSLNENNVYKDILYLNVTHHGYAYKYGEKVYKWYKYVHENYPDAVLGARIDDDVFLCVPQMLNRLNELKSAILYYGWKHGKGNKPHRDCSIDEMFVVLGRDLIKRIADRHYCGSFTCTNDGDLVERNYGSTSLSIWLSIYKDVYIHADNDRMIFFSRRTSKRDFLKFQTVITKNFCNKYLMFHKSLPETMIELHNLNTIR